MNLLAKMRQGASENPFYGNKSLFELYQASQSGTISNAVLTSAFNASKTRQELELFYSILFATGDISNREHFGIKPANGKLEQGGNGHRKAFQTILTWMKTNAPHQYEKFLKTDVVRQYTCLDNVVGNRIKTKPGSKTIVETVDFLSGSNLDVVSDYLAWLINHVQEGEKALIAKFLPNVRLSARQKQDRKTKVKSGKRELQTTTKTLMQKREQFYVLLSEKLGWKYETRHGWMDFIGLREWKQKYNTDLESVLFSTKKILAYDKTQFLGWLDKLPSSARFRVRCRLLDKNNALKGKWINEKSKQDLGTWFLDWEKSKEKAQAEQRELTEKVRQGSATEEDKVKLAKVTKEAKVNVGGSSLLEELEALLKSTRSMAEIDIKIHSILQKVKFEVPVLTIADCSGSMNEGNRTGGKFMPFQLAQLFATISMLKNPSPDLDDLLVCFGSQCEIYTDGSVGTSKQNRFVQGVSTKVAKLVDRTKSFSENFTNIGKFVNSEMGGTSFDTVAKKIKQWIESDTDFKQHRIEQLLAYPVFMVISDGDMNNSYSAASSLMEFRGILGQYGWDGVVVIWDVNTGMKQSDKFTNVPNTLHFCGWNLGIVNQIFTKIHDLDVIDTYLPLKTLWESNRYELVRKNVI